MAKNTVLIVDDEYLYLDAISNLLPDHEFTILRAVNGEMAYQVALKRVPDIIIMDWDMPVLTGIEATQKLKADSKTRHIPIIMSTGVMTSAEDLQIALSAGAVDYIRKPVDKLELLARMNSVLTIAHSFQKIQEQKKALERSNLTKERLLAIVAHDLNSPLSSLSGTLGLVRIKAKKQAINAEELMQLFDHIEGEFQSVVELMNNLLLWALHQQDALRYHPIHFSIDEVIKPCIRLINGRVEQKEIEFTQVYDSSLSLVTDKDMLAFIIRNLLVNAVKFTPEKGKIHMEVSQQSAGLYWKISDTGVGIAPEQLHDLFAQIDPNRSRHDTHGKKGTGVGLAMSKEFALKMRSELWAESTLGEGSVFYLKLPHDAIATQE
ncbi:MAG: hybrid sensor histidine kinase/response regulator [Flammeovirgaceae bacterium]